MSIDEAIRYEREKAKELNKRALDKNEIYPNICKKLSEEHEQIAEWLEDYKKLLELKEVYSKGMETSYAEFRYEQGRADEREEWKLSASELLIKYAGDIYEALPDIVKQIKADAINEFVKECCEYEDLTFDEYAIQRIKSIAEQLKEKNMDEIKIGAIDGVIHISTEEFERVVANIRAEAIDELVRFANTMPTVENDDGEIRPMWLEEMAEQLKEQNNDKLDGK